jgi:hypothetical protein
MGPQKMKLAAPSWTALSCKMPAEKSATMNEPRASLYIPDATTANRAEAAGSMAP